MFCKSVVINDFFNLRKRAKDLLDNAKRVVEIAIDQDEQTAIKWLESVDLPHTHLPWVQQTTDTQMISI